MPPTRRQSDPPTPPDDAALLVNEDQPLIAVPVDGDGQPRVAYYTSDAAADAALTDEVIRRAKALAGAWADLNWDEVAAELHRIRHQTPPTPPAEDALGALLGDDPEADDRGAAAS
jgi:hypothetical protein